MEHYRGAFNFALTSPLLESRTNGYRILMYATFVQSLFCNSTLLACRPSKSQELCNNHTFTVVVSIMGFWISSSCQIVAYMGYNSGCGSLKVWILLVAKQRWMEEGNNNTERVIDPR